MGAQGGGGGFYVTIRDDLEVGISLGHTVVAEER